MDLSFHFQKERNQMKNKTILRLYSVYEILSPPINHFDHFDK